MAPSRDHLVHRACVAAGFEPRIAYVTRDPLAIGELVGAGLAVTLVPELLAEPAHGLAMVELEDAVPRRALYALMPAAGVRPRPRATSSPRWRRPSTGVPPSRNEVDRAVEPNPGCRESRALRASKRA